MPLWRSLFSSAQSAAVPAGRRVYAIGDIHGRSDLLDRLLGLIHRDLGGYKGTPTLIFIGDYVDRGSDSRGVIDILLDVATRFPAHFLRGNHDQAMLDFATNPHSFTGWRNLGGAETLLSYGVRPPTGSDGLALSDARARFNQAVPPAHWRLLRELESAVEVGDYFFTHAGVRPGVPLDRQNPQDLMWIREEFLQSEEDFGKVVVHGHSPSSSPVRKSNRIAIDTGAYQSGKLTAAVFEASSVRFLQS
jgi:serine/threonine protein phosphatase 1